MISATLQIVVGGSNPAAAQALATRLRPHQALHLLGTGSDAVPLARMLLQRQADLAVLVVDSVQASKLVALLCECTSTPLIAICASESLGVASLGFGAMEWLPESASLEAIAESARLMAGMQRVRRWPLPGAAPTPADAEPQPFKLVLPSAALPGSTSPNDARGRGPATPLGRMVVIGGSTGAPLALLELFAALQNPYPAPLIVAQHMPHDYSEAFVRWLASSSKRQVRLATSGERPAPGVVYVAPAQQDTTLDLTGLLQLEEHTGKGATPSVDRLFQSLAKLRALQRFGVLLTGMGQDGAQGLLALRSSGARTLAQSEASSTVFGMPHSAAEFGAAEALRSPIEIGNALEAWLLIPAKQER